MSRYFFNLQGEGGSTLDLVGRDFANDEDAKLEAARIAGEFETADEISGLIAYDWIEILDQGQRPVARLPLGRIREEPNRID